MKYEIKLICKDRVLSQAYCVYRTLVSSERAAYVINEFEEKAKKYPSEYKVYDAWVQVNLMDDDGNFVEVIK